MTTVPPNSDVAPQQVEAILERNYRLSVTTELAQELGKAWDETKHPRGQPKNAGQFSEAPGGGAAVAEQHAPRASRRKVGQWGGVLPPAEPVPAVKQPAAPVKRPYTAPMPSSNYDKEVRKPQPRPGRNIGSKPAVAAVWNDVHRAWNQDDYDSVEGVVLGGNLKWNDHPKDSNWKSADASGGKIWANKIGNRWEAKFQGSDGFIANNTGSGIDPNTAAENLFNRVQEDIDNGLVLAQGNQSANAVRDSSGNFVPQINWKVKFGEHWDDAQFNDISSKVNEELYWEDAGNDEQVANLGDDAEIRVWKSGDASYKGRLLVGGKAYNGIGTGFYPDGVASDLITKARDIISQQKAIELARVVAAEKRKPGVVASGEYVAPNLQTFGKPCASPLRTPEDMGNIEGVLEKNDILNVRKFGEQGINDTFIGNVKDDGKAIVKPQKGDNGDPEHEVLAYEFAKSVGFSVVPATVYREWKDGRNASSMEFVENSVMGYEMTDEDRSRFDEGTWDSLSEMFVFDLVTGNGDRHSGNLMYNRDTNRFAAIDNGFCLLLNNGTWENEARGGMRNALQTTLWRYGTDKFSDGNYGNSEYLGLQDPMEINIKQSHVDAMDRFVNSTAFTDLLAKHLSTNDVPRAREQAEYGLNFIKTKLRGQIIR
jgi:hypothetical protein